MQNTRRYQQIPYARPITHSNASVFINLAHKLTHWDFTCLRPWWPAWQGPGTLGTKALCSHRCGWHTPCRTSCGHRALEQQSPRSRSTWCSPVYPDTALLSWQSRGASWRWSSRWRRRRPGCTSGGAPGCQRRWARGVGCWVGYPAVGFSLQTLRGGSRAQRGSRWPAAAVEEVALSRNQNQETPLLPGLQSPGAARTPQTRSCCLRWRGWWD